MKPAMWFHPFPLEIKREGIKYLVLVRKVQMVPISSSYSKPDNFFISGKRRSSDEKPSFSRIPSG